MADLLKPIAGVDVGGTFTDLVLFEPQSGSLKVKKVPSTPEDQSKGIVAGLKQVLSNLEILERLDHGTTVSTNALLEGEIGRVALITSAGFGDVLEIGRTRRMLPSVYDTKFVRPSPLVPRHWRFEVAERLDKYGNVITPLDTKKIEKLLKTIVQVEADAIAVCFLHAYNNPDNELLVLKMIEEIVPSIGVAVSHQVVREFREYERFSTTVINASLIPIVNNYLSNFSKALADQGYNGMVYTMASNGGTMDLSTAQRLPIRTILSGPAAGIMGALWVAGTVNVCDFVTCDMGGTSTDVCLIEDSKPSSVNETAFVGYPIKGRQLDIKTVGAGGGSIAFVEAGNTLKVGPRSAGAQPGPACYGRGGLEPTVTDANLVLGRIGGRRLGGSLKLEKEFAEAAVGSLAERLGIDKLVHMADGIVKLAVAQMASAIREITVERGYDPADFSLVAFGGAGPMHATLLAEEIGMAEVMIPIYPGNLSAAGLLASDQRYEVVRTFLQNLGTLELSSLIELRTLQIESGTKELVKRGFSDKEIEFSHSIDMRYARQAFEINVEFPNSDWTLKTLKKSFLSTYERFYGNSDAEGDIEIVNVRTAAIGITQKPTISRLSRRSTDIREAVTGKREGWFNSRIVPILIYEREHLPIGVDFIGPAIVEEDGATTVITPGWGAQMDEVGNLRLKAIG